MADETKDQVAEFLDKLDVTSASLRTLVDNIRSKSGPIHVVVSILAGTGKAEEFYKKHIPKFLAKFDLKQGDDYTTHFTKSATTVTELAQEVFAIQARSKQVFIILLSGDGGIVDLLNGLAASAHKDGYVPPIVAVLPFGTANALAHSSRVASDETFGLSTLCHGSPKQVPIFSVQFSPGARLVTDEGRRYDELPQTSSIPIPLLYGGVVCSWGFHAAIVADSDTAEFRKHGIERFKMAANEALWPSNGKGPHEYVGDVYLSRNGKWIKIPREKHSYILATTVSNLEQKFVISPASKPMDGSLRLVHFGPMGADDVMKVMMQAYDGGKHVDEETVGYETIDGLWIDFKEDSDEDDDGQRWRRVCVDGKIIAVEKDGWICVTKDPTTVLELIVPPR
ncbi:hypothetical protein NA57DRAFT_41491 [Rhizodiscina lignyota]|uniref:DAGKc domain-containing protein n=1 Tax=Rhizodiscina lignyota TaxID=1504668 RepID=A0A9P4IAC2_9PEZI|nr:hypothetical protein NA57DRAFT_41491 [Rhizodiscina lignyota]